MNFGAPGLAVFASSSTASLARRPSRAAPRRGGGSGGRRGGGAPPAPSRPPSGSGGGATRPRRRPGRERGTRPLGRRGRVAPPPLPDGGRTTAGGAPPARRPPLPPPRRGAARLGRRERRRHDGRRRRGGAGETGEARRAKIHLAAKSGLFSGDRLTLPAPDDLLPLETRTERKERSHEVVRLAPEYEGRPRSTGPDFKRKVRVSFTFWSRFVPAARESSVCSRLPGVDSNHQELINSQSCCRYITGERRCRG